MKYQKNDLEFKINQDKENRIQEILDNYDETGNVERANTRLRMLGSTLTIEDAVIGQEPGTWWGRPPTDIIGPQLTDTAQEADTPGAAQETDEEFMKRTFGIKKEDDDTEDKPWRVHKKIRRPGAN